MDLSFESINNDLKKLEPLEFYNKYIKSSINWYFSEYQKTPDNEILDKIDSFKNIVSTILNIELHDTHLVGSAKIGFSLSPEKYPQKFGEGKYDSDIDIALVSEKAFNKLWDLVRIGVKKQHTVNYSKICHSIFRGYINITDCIDLSTVSDIWGCKIDNVNINLQDKLGVVHPISYRVYRYWSDLEDYQMYGINHAIYKIEVRNV